MWFFPPVWIQSDREKKREKERARERLWIKPPNGKDPVEIIVLTWLRKKI